MAVVLVATISVAQLALPQGVLPAFAADPVAPPAAVNPVDSIRLVTMNGPTVAPSVISVDTVWGPLGSPYIVHGTVTVKASLTMLPGTVVKIDGQMSGISVSDVGQLLVLGSRDARVVITSFKDDTAMGDSNGDGSASSPAPGDWRSIQVWSVTGTNTATMRTPPSVIDQADIRFGGYDTGGFSGEVEAVYRAHFVLSNSLITDSSNMGFHAQQSSSDSFSGNLGGFVGVYGNTFARNGGNISSFYLRGDIVGNTLGVTTRSTDFYGAGAYISYPSKGRFWFNRADSWVTVNGSSPQPTRATADVRFNHFTSGAGGWYPASQNLTDWSANWWGLNINDPSQLPACATQSQASAFNPPLVINTAKPCAQSGYYEVTGVAGGVGPGLSSAPQVLPPSLAEAAAPTFGPVNTFSGALTYAATDMSVEDAGKKIAATRTYRSDRLTDGDAGTGWISAYSEALSSSGGSSVLSLSDGSSLPFNVDAAAGYTPSPGVSADIVTGASGSTVTSNSQTGYEFDASGELTGVVLGDAGHRVQVDRSGGKVAKVTGVSNRFIEFERGSAQKLTGFTDSAARTVEMAYSGSRLASVTGVDGQTETYEYDAAGRLTTVTTPLGLVKLAAGYDSSGRVSWVEQQGLGRATIGYDESGHKSTITLADGRVITQEYDDLGRLVSETLGASSRRLVYDGLGGVAASITGIPNAPMEGYVPAASLTFTDGKGNPAMTVDPTGIVQVTTFNSRNKPLVTTRNDSSTVTRTYDGAGRLDTLIDPAGKPWKYTFNSRGQVLTATDPLNRIKTIVYAGNGDVASAQDERGATSTFEYDALGRRVAVVDALGARSETTYTPWDATATSKTPRGGVTTTTFDHDRRKTSTADPTGVGTSYEYDAAGRLNASVDTAGKRMVTEFDATGRVAKVTDARGSVYLQTYTPEGWEAISTDPSNAQTTTAYDPSGRAHRKTDALGQVTQTRYDRAGRVTDTWTPDGAHTVLGYDVMGRKATEITPRGKTWKTSYDITGHPTVVTDPLAFTTSTSYDAIGRPLTFTDQNGIVTTVAYNDTTRTTTTSDLLGTISIVSQDVLGRTASESDAAGATTTRAYDSDGNTTALTVAAGTSGFEYDLAQRPTAEVDRLGRRTTAHYDNRGRMADRTFPDTSTEVFGYDEVGNVTGRTDRTGALWTFNFDASNRATVATDPLGHETHIDYDVLGRQRSLTDPAGVVINTAYNPVGRPAVTWDASGASWVTSYDLDGNVATEVDPGGVTDTYTYDNASRMTSKKWGSVTSSYTYDKVGRQLTATDPYLTTNVYDIRGRLASAKDALNNITRFVYDPTGRPVKQTSPGGFETAWTYDSAGQIVTAADPLGNTSHYDYYADGQLKKLTLPRGGEYTSTYDEAGRLDTETDPLGKVTGYDYDAEGRTTLLTRPSGQTITASYDAAGRQTQTIGGGTTRTFGYDDAGKITTAGVTGDATLARSFGYNNRGLMERSTDSFGDTTYSYDAAKRLTGTTAPTGPTTTFTYDTSRGLLATIRGVTNRDFSYNSAGQLTGWNSATGTSTRNFTTNTYDTVGRLIQASGNVYGAKLTYDADGRVATVCDSIASNCSSSPKLTTYGYDNAGHLSSAAVTQSGSTLSSSAYAWDADDNRTSSTTSPAAAITADYDLADRLTATSDGSAYGYDEDGQQIARGSGTSYSYNAFGELTGAVTPGGTVGYGRDALGRVATRTAGTTAESFSYDGQTSNLANWQRNGGTPTTIIRTPDGMPLAEATGTAVAQQVVQNFHGDLVGLNDDNSTSSANVRYRAGYDPFGTVTSSTGTQSLPLGYQSMYTDQTTGMLDMGARHYDPASGRFTARDTIVGSLSAPISLNRYLYANGNPISNTDPTGHWPDWVDDLGKAAGAAVDDTISTAFKGDAISTLFKGLDAVDRFERHATVVGITEAAALWSRAGAGAFGEPAAQVHDFVNQYGGQILATAASVGTGVGVFVGCAALTAGVGSVLCAGLAGAAAGAVYSGMTCPAGAETARCVAIGAVTGAAAGLTGGAMMSAGLGMALAGAGSSFVGDGLNQLITVGTIDPGRLASATVTGGLVGGVFGAAFRGRTGPPAVCHSFDPATQVLMADGSTKPIKDVKLGDEVTSTDPDTGQTTAETVSALHINKDSDLTDLTIKDEKTGKSAVLHTTARHPFWNADSSEWVDAAKLKPGTHLFDPDARGTQTVVAVNVLTGSEEMRDLTVDTVHTYFVLAGDTPVLVHNCGSLPPEGAFGRATSLTTAMSVDELLPTPQVGSQKLQNIVNNLYKGTTNPNRIGNGTTMDAIRNELATGAQTGSKWHIVKGQESLIGLNNWLRRSQGASYRDRLVAQSLTDELTAILRGAP